MKRTGKTAVKNKGVQTAVKSVSVPEIKAEKVSFILVAKKVLCFRECAKIVMAAENTGCMVQIVSGNKSGTSESIMSLASLGITSGTSLVLTISGERNEEAFHEIAKIINDSED